MNYIHIVMILIVILVISMIYTFSMLGQYKNDEKSKLLNTMKMKNDFDIDDGSYMMN